MTTPEVEDPFEGREPIEGLEYLGRAIVGSEGQISGSPANYEATRGKTGRRVPSPEDAAVAIARVNAMFAGDVSVNPPVEE